MGNRILQAQYLTPQVMPMNTTQQLHGQPDYRSQARGGRLATVDAPWNVTQWVDPFDPHPKTPTMPVLLIVRK